MTDIAKCYSSAELSLAAYATLTAGSPNTEKLKEAGFSDSQATHFAATYTVVDQYSDATGLSATIFQQGTQTYLAIRGTQDPLDALADFYLWKGVPAGANPQYQSLKAKVAQWLGNGKLSAGFTVAGHSLGGYLAAGLLADFSSSIRHAYLYNAPGNNSLVSIILQALRITTTPDASRITNLRADAGISPIANLGINFAPPIPIAIENQFASGVSNPPAAMNHSQQVLTDALAVYAAYAQLAPALTIDQIGTLIKEASGTNSRTLESSLDALRTLLMDGRIATDIARRTAVGDREVFYTNLQALQNGSAYTALSGSAAIRLLDATPAAILADQARTDFGNFLALNYLIPFTLTGADSVLTPIHQTRHDAWQADRDLTPEQRRAGQATYTDEWHADRAAMLGWLLKANAADQTYVDSGQNLDGAWYFADNATNKTVLVQPAGGIGNAEQDDTILGDFKPGRAPLPVSPSIYAFRAIEGHTPKKYSPVPPNGRLAANFPAFRLVA